MSTLDCESYESTLECFAQLHGVSQSDVETFIKTQHPDELQKACEDSFESWDDILYGRWLDIAEDPEDWDETCWFHATRLFSGHTIWNDGLLTLSEMKEELWTQLKNLCDDEVDDEAWQSFVECAKSSYGYGSKQNEVAEGPFAFLIFEPLEYYSSGNTANRDYFQGSELIEDICLRAGQEFGENLWEKYQSATSASVVKFSTPPQGYEMEVALHYLWVKEWEPDLVCSVGANTCYDGEGESIAEEDIVDVYEIDE